MMQVCASGVPLVCAPPRPLWPSLASAASTLALIGVANWGIADFIGQESRLAFYPLLFLGLPFLPLLLSLKNASSVWIMKRSIHKRLRSTSNIVVDVDTASVPILCGCPLFIQVPSSAISENDSTLLFKRGYSKLHNYPKDDCPLQLAPKGAPALSSDHQQQKYLKLSMKYFNFENIKEREVLLTLGLAPEFRQLLFLRSRSRFQTVVTALQAGGYLLGVVQRLAQHRALCPLEALLCFLSVIILLQLLLEFYACSHYARPLLLCLSQEQFSKFWEAPRDDTESVSYRRSLKRHRIIPPVTVMVLLVMLFSALSILYSMHYMNSCVLCSVAAFLFVFALHAWAVGFGFVLKQSVSLQTVSVTALLLWTLSALTLVCSMVLAVVSTAIHWDLFHSPTSYSFSWILPHISS